MDLGKYERCDICGRFDFTNKHKCPPVWEVKIPDYHGDEWQKQYAYQASVAATQMAEEYDSEYFRLLDGEEVEVLVRKPGETVFKKYLCTGEAVPEYRSLEIT